MLIMDQNEIKWRAVSVVLHLCLSGGAVTAPEGPYNPHERET